MPVDVSVCYSLPLHRVSSTFYGGECQIMTYGPGWCSLEHVSVSLPSEQRNITCSNCCMADGGNRTQPTWWPRLQIPSSHPWTSWTSRNALRANGAVENRRTKAASLNSIPLNSIPAGFINSGKGVSFCRQETFSEHIFKAKKDFQHPELVAMSLNEMAKLLNILRPEPFQLIHYSFLHYFIKLFIQQSSYFKYQDGKPQKGPSRDASCCGYVLLTRLCWNTYEKHFSIRDMMSNKKTRQTIIYSYDTFPIVSVFLTPSVGLLCWCCQQHQNMPKFSHFILCFQHAEWFCTRLSSVMEEEHQCKYIEIFLIKKKN